MGAHKGQNRALDLELETVERYLKEYKELNLVLKSSMQSSR